MSKILIYEDLAGNQLMKDVDNRLVLINKKGKLVNPYGVKSFISRPPVRIALKRYFGEIPYIKILDPDRTQHIRNKTEGALY